MACLTSGLAYTPPPLRLRQDGARDQTSAATSAFVAQQAVRLQVFQWPTSAPDDHPLEQLWQKRKQQDTHLHYCPPFEALTDTVEQARLQLAHRPEEMLALCGLP